MTQSMRIQAVRDCHLTVIQFYLFVALTCLLVSGTATLAQAQPDERRTASAQPLTQAALPAGYGRHFIVLIDDSASITGDKQTKIRADLPSRLFGGIKGLPTFDPASDRVSVLFFTIMNGSASCGRQPRSVLPKNIFHLAYTGKLRSQAEFAEKLNQWMSDDCHFHGNWSPIVSSSLLVLPFLQQQPELTQGELHTQTFLIQVTDGKFNSRTTPGHELIDYQRLGSINHVAEADRELNEVGKLFSLNILPNQQALRDVFYLAAEYTPQRMPESAVQYQRNSLLYPQAVNGGALRYRLNDQLLGDIQLVSQGAGYSFKPLWLRTRFENAQGQDWSMGGQSLPRQGATLDLTNCVAPQCRREGERLGVGLFEAGLGGPFEVSRYSFDPEPGKINFSVGFHYDTEKYNHLCAETPELEINAQLAPPAEIPNPLFFPSSYVGKSDVAAQWQRDGDGITTQDEAKNRIQASRNLKGLLISIGLVLAAIATTLFLFLRYYSRKFAPELEWLPAPEVVVDFNRPAASRLLVGTLQVVNDQPVPKLGQWFGNDEQPTRSALIGLFSNDRFRAVTAANNGSYDHSQERPDDEGDDDDDDAQEIQLMRNSSPPFGFVRASAMDEDEEDANELTVTAEESVSDGKQIHVFLASEVITDCKAPQVSEAGQQFDFGFRAKMEWFPVGNSNVAPQSRLGKAQSWVRKNLAAEQAKKVKLPSNVRLTVKPEVARKPRVTYTSNPEPQRYFQKGNWVHIGDFVFESQAEHEFACPYEWGDYVIQTYLDNRSLGGEPIRLGQPRVTVKPKETVPIPVYLYCDGETIPNPDPAFCTYSFKLIGDFDPTSESGPYTTTLHRDPTRAEIELTLIHQQRETEIYWTPQSELKLRSLTEGADTSGFRQDNETILLPPQSVKFSHKGELTCSLLDLKIGNTGTAGRGAVTVDFDVQLKTVARIEMSEGRKLGDLVDVYPKAGKIPEPHILVPEGLKLEGQNPQIREIRLFPASGLIERIPTARIEADALAVEVQLAIRVRDDQGNETTHSLKILLPLSLEQLPGENWLAIDFGTSAITAAIGTGRPDGVTLIPLQEINVPGGRSFAQYDTENAERHGRYRLPSWVICDADLRSPTGDRQRPGFPGYYPKDGEELTLTPGESDFIGLPAVTHNFEEHTDRVIYSLKSWLGKASGNIRLPVKIRIQENGKSVDCDTLPLDKVVESGFAALADAYLLANGRSDYHADRIVLLYPNTFTKYHQDLLHGIAYRALRTEARFGIPLPERIRLISESDAVAYYYCTKRAQENPPQGSERILVYDFGAGTLDLSLINVEWEKTALGSYPILWQVEKRLGVPVAGNFIDETLARLIHRLLENSAITRAGTFKYRFPVVSRSLSKNDRVNHRRAIIHLWNWIREAKQQWSDKCREVLAGGGTWQDCPAMQVKVGILGEPQMVTCEKGGEDERHEPLNEEAGLWVDEGGYIRLLIPAALIHQDARMEELTRFVAEEVVDELLKSARVLNTDVDTVIVSGRGALFPGLRDCVWNQFRDAEKPDLFLDDAMKEAVVLGAIARQDLSQTFEDKSSEADLSPRLAVLINHDQQLVFEDDWDKPINLIASPTFRVVQVSLQDPNPREDMRTLRKHFYLDVTDRHFRREEILAGDSQLYVRKETNEGKLAIYLGGRNNSVLITDLQVTRTVTAPPWPVGNVLLDPQG